MKNFDHIIIGMGQALGTLLGKLIPTGNSIEIIGGGEVGGSCVNFGVHQLRLSWLQPWLSTKPNEAIFMDLVSENHY